MPTQHDREADAAGCREGEASVSCTHLQDEVWALAVMVHGAWKFLPGQNTGCGLCTYKHEAECLASELEYKSAGAIKIRVVPVVLTVETLDRRKAQPHS